MSQPLGPDSGQDPFERELRDELAALAARPAPDSLLERIAAIPVSAGPRRHRSFASLAGAFGSVALVAATVVLVLFARLGPVGPAGPSAGPSGVVPSSMSPAPSTASASRPADSPTPAPTSTLSPASSSSPASSGLGSLPAGFRAVSVSFVTADVGWLLGSAAPIGAGCGSSVCTALARTDDGGQTWSLVAEPLTRVIPADGPPAAGSSMIRFADARNGWLVGPSDVWSTHDGGATWAPVTLPEHAAGAAVFALAAADGIVHAAYDAGGTGIAIASSPVGSEGWLRSATTIPFGAGPVPSARIVLAGGTGWVIEVDRTVVGGARLVGGRWVAWQPPCLDVAGPAALAAADASHLVAACDIGLWSTPEGERLYVSGDGGSTFTAAGSLPLQHVVAVAAPDASTVVMAGSGTSGVLAIETSLDGGRTWRGVQRFPAGSSVADLGFVTAADGAAVVIDGSGVGQLWLTADAGRTWRQVTS